MKRWIWRALLLAALIAAGIWTWHRLFPGPEQIIRKHLTELARAASIAPNEAPLTKLSNTIKIASYFAQDADLLVDVPGQSVQAISGKENIRNAAGGARGMVNSLRVDFVDLTVSVAADRKSAVARLTARADLPGESTPAVQELKVDFRKLDGEWLIQHAETVKTLR